MNELPRDWIPLLALVFVLGLKHGMDADHLATIDGLTRYNTRLKRRVARWCGSLFSLGHGAIVIAISLAVGLASERWEVPAWMEAVGGWISIAFLTLLGVVNLRAVVAAGPHDMVAPIGLKGRFLGRLQRTGNPLLIAAVGALFALSFDTMSQAALFAVTATQYGGWEHALLLGAAFVVGMLLTDGINGLWISRLLRRADQVALLASRLMGLMVGGVSLLVAGFGVAKSLSPAVDTWSGGKELYFGIGVIAVIAGSFVAAMLLARQPVPAPQTSH